MAFLAELMVNEYGFLHGGEGVFPVDVINHDWETPYPPFKEVADFLWEAGEAGVQPNVFRHPEIRDWVCDETALSVLRGLAPSDLHLIGTGQTGGKNLHIVQLPTVLDIVDRDASIIDKYESYEILQFPSFYRRAEGDIRDRLFRVPGSYTDVFVGAGVRASLDAANITGLRYVPVPFTG